MEASKVIQQLKDALQAAEGNIEQLTVSNLSLQKQIAVKDGILANANATIAKLREQGDAPLTVRQELAARFFSSWLTCASRQPFEVSREIPLFFKVADAILAENPPANKQVDKPDDNTQKGSS